jgi:DNA-directed RNA polymerase specialized sigma24 family protein
MEPTRWSMITSLRDGDAARSRKALEELCQAYWTPLWAWARRQGLDAEASADLVQGFFAMLLEKEDFAELAPERGKFRSWLLAALRHHWSHEREKAAAAKRGGGAPILRIHAATADGELLVVAADEPSPEAAYERQWALHVMATAARRLREAYAAEGKAELHAALEPALQGELEDVAAIARRLSTSEGAVRVAASRLRRRFGDELRAMVAETVEEQGEVEEELAALLRALSAR